MMSMRGRVKKSWIFGILSCLLAAYMVVSAIMSSGAASNRLCRGVLITVHDTAELKFVTPLELARELGSLPKVATQTRLADIDMDSLERKLQQFDKIERVTVNALTNGKIHIDVWPMRPVVRVFPDNGESYYINRSGKKIMADPRYYLDVPVVYGHFDDSFTEACILPVVDYISGDSTWNNAISMIKVDSPTDIILVPVIRGHVINIGDTADLSDKLARVRRMYREVFPVKGWEYYDTISVKWGGQIVATRRNKPLPEPKIDVPDVDESDDINTMLVADDVAPGQTKPGVPAKSDKPIPAALVKHKNDTTKTKQKTP